ncbi:conserved hypothetical protein [Trichinella spiralis]|uniref:hypothetical protein n=1 Tax=Trichinella spiralis TaxID=6334 RepID=UPI0001EFCBA1|nr:conserved hypothetical protein [Trichinella spiralis]
MKIFYVVVEGNNSSTSSQHMHNFVHFIQHPVKKKQNKNKKFTNLVVCHFAKEESNSDLRLGEVEAIASVELSISKQMEVVIDRRVEDTPVTSTNGTEASNGVKCFEIPKCLLSKQSFG